ncbi:hypothetical protein I4F81_011233 [Pyropia yezoensis]|uniref:Uncharacterized protein n=1 Tax=Pyropia yezoensis TaxID=2788 RepID=A0ACC3CF82_PYRYE|nr:hypothetical protein I4F81_011233 [Neopyropia yezoensis]
MALADSPRSFIAMITAETSRLVMSSDDATIAARILALDVGALLVTGAFATTSAAVCWLTDPVSTDAVQASQLLELPRRSSAPAASGGWLAVMATGSRACFEIDSAGVGGAVMLVKASRARVCAVTRLADAAGAYDLFVSHAVKDLVDLLSRTAGSFLQRENPRIEGPSPPRSTAVVQAASVFRPSRVASTLSPGNHHDTCASGTVNVRAVPHVGTGMHGAVVDAVVVESSMPARSPFAVWAAREEIVEPENEERSRRSHFQSGPRSRKRGARALSPSSDAQSSAAAAAGAADSSGLTRRPRPFLPARMSSAGRARCSHNLPHGQTYHSFFGFARDYKAQKKDPFREARRLLQSDRFSPIRRRLAQVRVLLLDEISMVAADNLDIMYELLKQSRREADPPFTVYAFGDFLQLGPLFGSMAFASKAWPLLFGRSMLELTRVHRQGQPDFVGAIKDTRFGRCTPELISLMKECSVSAEQYKDIKCKVLHLMPRHEDVQKHNAQCLAELSSGSRPADFEAVDFVQEDKDRDMGLNVPALHRVSTHSRDAALFDCVAPHSVPHCKGARVMLTTNAFLPLGLYHGSIGSLDSYDADGTPVVLFTRHALPPGVGRGMHGVRDAGRDWIKVACPPVNYEARILAHPGAVAVRCQVPFVLGWAITVYRSQSLTLSEVVLDIASAFGAGMVNAAISRVNDKRRMYVKSFAGNRVLADPSSLSFYRLGTRL